ncbi:hypothetical protein [Reyranella sp.]|uniref:hypothetical protein n=1 Tax=Reyranella sp. TaxID=1929291 RepID=UPI003F6F6367
MFKTVHLILLLLPIGLCGISAQAAEPQGQARAQWAVGAGFGPFVEANRSHEATGAGRHISESTTAGVAWQAGGFTATVSGGRYAYDYTGAGIGAGRHTSFALGHEVARAGGTFSVELRQSRLWEGESQLDVTSARMGWSLKF